MSHVARLGATLGPVVVLWAVIPVLLRRSIPGASWALVVSLAVVGAVLQGTLRVLSSRGWFAGARSPAALWAASLGLAAALSAALCAAAVLGRTTTDVDLLMLGAVWFTMATLLLLAFRGRIEFRRWILFHRGVSERARPFATAELGPDRSAVHDFIRQLTAEVELKGSVGVVDVQNAARWVRLASDDRYRRAVPWSTARRLLESFVDHVERVSAAHVTLEVSAGAEDVLVVLQPVCDLIQDLSVHPSVWAVAVASRPTPSAGLHVRIACSLAPDREAGPVIEAGTARTLQQLAVTIEWPSPDVLVCRVEFETPRGEHQEDAIEEFLSTPAELFSTSPFSGGARSLYRRGNAVIKVQRHNRIDPKPTLLEDEFHLLRRLQGRSSRFPAALGYGLEPSFSWISYTYVTGEPLEEWLGTHRAEATARLLSFGVDIHEMLDVLASCEVAHRDLNPGNMILDSTGGLVLLDFDQAASGPDFVGADVQGVDSGLAKNDLVEFLEKTCLTRAANEWLHSLEKAWPEADAPFSLGVLGHRFGRGWRLDPFLEAARRRLNPIGRTRVLDLCSQAPIAGLLLASAGATVTALVDDPSRWERLGRLVGPRFEMLTSTARVEGSFDLTWAVGAEPPTAAGRAGPVIREWTGSGEQSPAQPWLLTTELTQLGP